MHSAFHVTYPRGYVIVLILRSGRTASGPPAFISVRSAQTYRASLLRLSVADLRPFCCQQTEKEAHCFDSHNSQLADRSDLRRPSTRPGLRFYSTNCGEESTYITPWPSEAHPSAQISRRYRPLCPACRAWTTPIRRALTVSPAVSHRVLTTTRRVRFV